MLQGEFMLDTALTTDNITSVVVDGTIPTDTPTTNYPLRVQDNNGFMRLLNYTARTGSTFTVDTTNGQEDFNTVNASLGSIVYIGYLAPVRSRNTSQPAQWAPTVVPRTPFVLRTSNAVRWLHGLLHTAAD